MKHLYFRKWMQAALVSRVSLRLTHIYLSFSVNVCSYVRRVRERVFVNTCSSMFEANVCSQACSFGNLTKYSTSLELSRTNRVNF